MIPMVGMLAFAIDVGYIVAVKSELQNAADAAALAGAQQLQQLYVQYYAPGQTSDNQFQIYTTATTNTQTSGCPTYAAEQFASYNQAGGVSVTVPDSDVTFSYWDGTNASMPASYPTYFPNTVTVVTRRDSSANGPLGLFFGRILGIGSIELTATASATIYAGDVSSLQVIPGVDAHILPVALDVNVWKQFYQTGLSPDGTIHLGANGLPQLQVYPTPGNAPGNFGLLDLGPPANNTPAFRNWINDGTTPNDIQYLLYNVLVPVAPNNPKSWKGGPGLTSTLVSNFQDQMGKPNLIPLFLPVVDGTNGQPYQAASGSGSNTYYNIVGFVGITVSQADSSGTSMDISIQPMANVDPTAILTNIQPARPSQTSYFGTIQTTFVSAKLTQ
jgi:Flp pilus assembly protein TadG